MLKRKSKTITYGGFVFTVEQASLQMGLKRELLHQATNRNNVESLETLAIKLTYPDVSVAVVKVEGDLNWPLSIDEYSELPEDLCSQLERATYELNPTWDVIRSDPAEDKKKE